MAVNKLKVVLWVVLPVSASLSFYVFLSILASLALQDEADVIITNAVIYTCDPDLPWADSMAVRKGRISRIGSVARVQVTAGPRTQNIDLQGKFVVPGFIDSHVHFISAGLQMAQVELRDIHSRVDFTRKVELAVQGARSGQWVLGGGWNNENWGGELPHASWIDYFSQQQPVWLFRMDGHMGLANSVALEKAGVNRNTLDPKGGSIIRDKDGWLTGILIDSAMVLIMRCIPEPSIEDRRIAFARASKHALSKGVTSVVDFGRFFPGSSTTKVWDDYHEVYKWADAVGNMSVRVSTFFPLETWSHLVNLVREKGHASSQWLRVGGLKAFADGSLGSNTALFHEPYVDYCENYGLEADDPRWLLNLVMEADQSNIQVAVHAIGDAANDEIEHAQHLSSGAPARFGALGIIASVQPQHLLDDAHFAAKKLGEERSLTESYLFNSLLKYGACLALGSDWPVVPLDPLEAIKAATKRVHSGNNRPWIPSEIISIEDAITGYTLSAAYASFMDHDIGSLSYGKLADFVLLSDMLNSSAEVSVLATYVGGTMMYSAE
eukprot:c18189_g1_i3 orf=660-2312(-)